MTDARMLSCSRRESKRERLAGAQAHSPYLYVKAERVELVARLRRFYAEP